MRSLKVVVQRALIELPRSLRRKCSVEERVGGEGREGEEGREGGEGRQVRRSRRVKREEQEETDSQLVTCQSCDITVHRGIYKLSLS